jgi:hypothetical protein
VATSNVADFGSDERFRQYNATRIKQEHQDTLDRLGINGVGSSNGTSHSNGTFGEERVSLRSSESSPV